MSVTADMSKQRTSYEAPKFASQYRWERHEKENRTYWYRDIDNMEKFVLHWQYRFHNHGDVYVSVLLDDSAQKSITVAHVREALRRMRSAHPWVGVFLIQRKDLGLAPLKLPATLSHVDLQVALAYLSPSSEAEVSAWLDEVVQTHARKDPVGRESEIDSEFWQHIREMTRADRPYAKKLNLHFFEADPATGRKARLTIESNHVLQDGYGLIHTLNYLLGYLAEVLTVSTPASIDWGSEIARLPPAVQDAVADAPDTWHVTPQELAQVEAENRKRMSGKATPPGMIDKVADWVLGASLRWNSSENMLVRALNRPLASVVQLVAQGGQMFPVGLRPISTGPYKGPRTNSAYEQVTLPPSEVGALIKALKAQQVTMAPFLEACMALATTWVRRERGLTKTADGYDTPERVIASFSNAISKRGTLQPEYTRYLGMCMGSFPTQIPASSARWSDEATKSAQPYKEEKGAEAGPSSKVPTEIANEDLQKVVEIAKKLTVSYHGGRDDKDWLRLGSVVMTGLMQSEYLLLSDEAYYPSNPWLSSLGRIDDTLQPKRSIGSDPSRILHASDMRITGRTAIAQPILHAYTYEKEMHLVVCYAEWVYGKAMQPLSQGQDVTTVKLWLSVIVALVRAAIQQHQATQAPAPSA